MSRSRYLIIFALVYFTSFVSGFSQKNPATLSEKQVDSLNELAFEVKRYDINRSLSILSSTELAAQQLNYQKGLATAYLYEGGVFLQNGNSKQAISLFYKALEISKETKDTFNITRAEQQLATAAHEKGQYKEAEGLLQKTIATYTRLGKQNEVINATNSLGLIYLEEKKYDSAQHCFELALQQSRKLNYLYGLKKSYFNLGVLSKELNHYLQAEAYLDSSYQLNIKAKDNYGIATTLIEVAQIDLREGENQKSISFAKTAFTSADSIDALQIQAQAAHILIDNYRKLNDLKQLTIWQDTLINIQHQSFEKDKNYSINFIEILKLQEQKNLNAQKQLQVIQSESRNRQIMLTIAVVILLLVFAMGIPFYLNYKKAKMIGLELEQKTDLIEKHSSSLDQLNKAISRQNLKLEEENKMKDKLLSIISHDLRHPLVNTKSILDLINLKLVSPKETNELLEQLESQYVRSLSLLDNLLFWIRGQMKGIKIERAKVNMYNLINTLIDEQRMAIQNKRIRLTNEIDKDIAWYAEKEMLKIVFRNLITNAVKFTPSEGTIALSSVQNDDITYLIVKDSGIGMSKETLEKVNARQYYSSKGTSNEKGSGFGLMLVRDLVQRHKGELLIESEPGRGSTFVVKFQNQAPEQEV